MLCIIHLFLKLRGTFVILLSLSLLVMVLLNYAYQLSQTAIVSKDQKILPLMYAKYINRSSENLYATAFPSSTENMIHWCRPQHFRSAISGSDDVIALASFPGSGNTWSRWLLQQATGIFTATVYNQVCIIFVFVLGWYLNHIFRNN